jgi:spermidine/putrescine transport system permease protein
MTRLRACFLAPAAIVLGGLFVAPLAIIAGYSLLTRGAYGGLGLPWTTDNWARLADPIYLGILVRTFMIAAVSTGICLLLAFPLALFIARSRRWKTVYLNLVLLPFWTSFLVRTYAWMFLLRDTGLINTILLSLHVIAQPLPLLYNNGAVVLGLVYAELPLMVLPLYATLEKLDRSLLEAAADLGAKPWATLTKVVVPLATPGIVAGGVLVFITCLGAFLTPDLLGGGKAIMIGNVVQNQFTSARDWPFGAAVSLALMGLVVLLLLAAVRRKGDALL